jgi:ribulose-5-phosphate 4-epimerase/fuculose-1-phosphate aldolase
VTDLKQTVATAHGVLGRLGLADYMGHASARVPGSSDRVVTKPRHSTKIKAMTSLRPEQMIVVDLDGLLVEGDDPPAKEVQIHTAIYRARPDVGGVVHTHQTLATIFGVVGRPILPLLHVESPLVARGVPIYPSPELIDTPELGDAVAQVLGDLACCHLQGHGIVTVGQTVEQATVRAIHLERLARANLLAAQLGTPRVITPEEIRRLESPMVGTDVRWAYYSSLLEDDTPLAGW